MNLSRDLRLLSLALFLWALGEGLFIFIIPIYLTDLGADSVTIGWVYAIGAVAMTASLLPAGWAADRFGPKSGLVSGWVIGVFSAVFFAIARDVSAFLIGWIMYRATAWVLPAISAYTTRARGDLTTERALSTVYSFFHAGLIISPTVGGYVGKYLDLRVNFYIAFLMFSLSSAVVLFLHHQPPVPVEHRAPSAELLKGRSFIGLMLLIFFIMSVLFTGYDFAPKFLNEVKGVSLEQIGWLGTLNAVGGFTLNQLLGRRPPRRGLMIAIGLLLIQVFVLVQATWIGWFALSYMLRGAFSAVRSLTAALVTRVVKPSQLGTAFGVSEMVTAAADVGAPYWGGWMYAAWPQLPFLAMMIFSPIAIALVWQFAPRGESAPQAAAATAE